MQLVKALAPEILDALRERRYFEVKEALQHLWPQDIVELLRELPKGYRVVLFRLLDNETAAEVFAELEPEEAEELLRQFTDEEVKELLTELPPDDRAQLFSELPPAVFKRLAALLPKEDREEVFKILGYPEDSAGRFISTDFLEVPESATAEEVLELIRRQKPEEEALYQIFVVDEAGRLVGSLSAVDLLRADPWDRMGDLAKGPVPTVRFDEPAERAVEVMKDYDLLAVPVVDSGGSLVGVITADDAMDIQEAEATEDIMRLGGLGEAELPLSPPVESARRRLPWVMLNFLTAGVASSVVALFRGVIDQYAILPAFMPIVAGMGGNAGSQTLAVMIRGLALGDVEAGEVLKVIGVKLLTGFLVGAAAGVAAGLFATLVGGTPSIGVLVTISLVLNVMLGCLAGVVVPVALQRMRLDPALGSGIIITGLTDTMGYFILFGLTLLAMRAGLFG